MYGNQDPQFGYPADDNDDIYQPQQQGGDAYQPPQGGGDSYQPDPNDSYQQDQGDVYQSDQNDSYQQQEGDQYQPQGGGDSFQSQGGDQNDSYTYGDNQYDNNNQYGDGDNQYDNNQYNGDNQYGDNQYADNNGAAYEGDRDGQDSYGDSRGRESYGEGGDDTFAGENGDDAYTNPEAGYGEASYTDGNNAGEDQDIEYAGDAQGYSTSQKDDQEGENDQFQDEQTADEGYSAAGERGLTYGAAASTDGDGMDAYTQYQLQQQQQLQNQYQQQQRGYPQEQAQPYDNYYANNYRSPEQIQKEESDKELRRNIVCVLVLTAIVFSLVLGALAVLVVLWVNDGDDTTTIIQATAAPIGQRAVTPAPLAPGTTAPPTAAPVTWTVRSGNSFTSTTSAPSFGSDVAMAGGVMVAGTPGNPGEQGEAESFSRFGAATRFTTLTSFTDAVAEQFGSAIDMAVDGSGTEIMVVGAQRTVGLVQSLVSFGAAFYYRRVGSEWQQVGPVIRSPEELEEAGALYGAAAALAATVERVAVGAPSSSIDQQNLDTGRLYTYELSSNGNTWNEMTGFLQGPAGSFFGFSVDMSDDGNRIIVGGPGNGSTPGLVRVYEWNGSSWGAPIYTVDGNSASTDGMGTTVEFINTEGTQFAVGAPGASNGAGLIRVFGSVDPTGPISVLGTIQGQSLLERIGTTLAGKSSRICFGTNTGFVRVYEYDGTEVVQIGTSLSTGTTDSITAIDMSTAGTTIAVASGAAVNVYDLA